MLIVCKTELTSADFARLDQRLATLGGKLRWTRRGGRLCVLVPGVRRDAGEAQPFVDDEAVDYVLEDPPPEELGRLFSRRELVDVALVTTGLLAAACVVGPIGLLLGSEARKAPGRDAYVGRIESIPVGGAVARMVDDRDVLVVRREADRFHVLSATCTHSEACLVEWDAKRSEVICPCHRGVFDVWGNVVSGPPPRPLEHYDAFVREGGLYVRRKSL